MGIKNILRAIKWRDWRVKSLKLLIASMVFTFTIYQWKRCVQIDQNAALKAGGDGLEIRRLATNTNQKGKSIVLLVADQRSGSTVVGEIFNQNPSAFYLFEPLFPFSKNCNFLVKERVDLLGDILQCKFDKMAKAYKDAFSSTKFTDKDAECANHNLCFETSHQPLLKKYASLCKATRLNGSIQVEDEVHGPPAFEPESKSCGFPLTASLLQNLCLASDVIAYKVLRLCSLHSMEQLFSNLIRSGLNVFVVHLVRDPRAIISSRVNLRIDGIRLHNAQSDIDLLCSRYKTNINYLENLSSSATSLNMVSTGRYLRVRHEDFTLKPQAVADQIYRFVGKEMPTEVSKFIFNSHQSMSRVVNRIELEDERAVRQKKEIREYTKNKEVLRQMNNPFGTVRDPTEVLKNWRMQLPYDVMQTVQRTCGDVLPKLGYELFHSKVDLVNLTKPYY